MNKLHKVASRFAKILKKVAQVTPQQPTGYGAILNIYNAAKQMKNEIRRFQEDSTTEQGIFPRVNNLFQNASKLLWNAAYKGITESTSARYHGLINDSLNSLVAYANNKNDNPYETNIYTTVLASSQKLSNALANFTPVSMPAQIKPKAPIAPYGTIESVPFGPPAPPPAPEKDMPAAYTGSPKSFDFGKFNPAKVPSGPARISNEPEVELPLSEHEQELEPWKTK